MSRPLTVADVIDMLLALQRRIFELAEECARQGRDLLDCAIWAVEEVKKEKLGED